MPYTLKIFFIIIISVFWVLVLPGYVAYKDQVFTGKDFMNRINDSIVQTRLSAIGGASKFYKDGHLLLMSNHKELKVSFSGFIDNQLNYIWVSTFTFIGIFIFIFYAGWLKNCDKWHLSFICLTILFLFDSPNWFRNSSLGQHGRTIYSYVNYDIDPLSYWLQELRVITFSFLLGAMLIIGENLKKEASAILTEHCDNLDLDSFVNFSIVFRESFLKWQRNMILIMVIFLPWTWFYWENITVYNDTRYLFAAILFHSFWVISICLFSMPTLLLRKNWWIIKTNLVLIYFKNDQLNKISQFEYFEPYPKFQFLASSVAALVSLFLPFIQIFIKK